MLKMTPTFKDAVVIRTRNPDILAKCNIVVDVGAKYEPEVRHHPLYHPMHPPAYNLYTTFLSQNLLFDHHQKEFQGTMNTGVHQYNTRLSSAGLVYKHYGKEIVAGLATGAAEDEVAQVYDRVYSGFMEHIDGIDNGVEPFAAASGEKLTKNYVVSTSLSSRVGNLAPRWNQPTDAESFNQGFVKAVALVTTEFLASVDYYANAWLPAAQVVKKCVADRLNVHESGRIVHLDTFCPWQEHLYDIERTLGLSGEVLYCLFPDSNRGYRVCERQIRCFALKHTEFRNAACPLAFFIYEFSLLLLLPLRADQSSQRRGLELRSAQGAAVEGAEGRRPGGS